MSDLSVWTPSSSVAAEDALEVAATVEVAHVVEVAAAVGDVAAASDGGDGEGKSVFKSRRPEDACDGTSCCSSSRRTELELSFAHSFSRLEQISERRCEKNKQKSKQNSVL